MCVVVKNVAGGWIVGCTMVLSALAQDQRAVIGSVNSIPFFEEQKVLYDLAVSYGMFGYGIGEWDCRRIHANYETARRDRVITPQQAELARRWYLLIGLACLTVAIILLYTLMYRHRLKKKRQTEEDMESMIKLREMRLRTTLANEKIRISRELHDNIGARLTYIISSLHDMSLLSNSKPLSSKLDSLSEFGRDTLEDLRNAVWAIRMEKGDVGQLTTKIKDFIQKRSGQGFSPRIVVHQAVPDDLPLSSIQMLNAMRIVQEAIQNAINHSNATKISIRFSQTEGELCLTVSDNGQGFNTLVVSPGNGISNMQGRCEELSGSFQLESGPHGTTLGCCFPPV